MAEQLEQLSLDLAAVSFVPEADSDQRFGQLAARARRLLEVKLAFEALRGPDDPPLVVIAGGTNVGKSTIFNWVVGSDVASSSPLARHTKAPTVYVHGAELGLLREGSFLPSYERLKLESRDDPAREESLGEGASAYFLLTHERDEVKGVVLVDSPDIDSTHARNREVAEDLLFLADVVLFVATPEKYNDALCVDYMEQATRLRKGVVWALNKGADEAVADDLRGAIRTQARGKEPPKLLELPYLPKPDPKSDAAFCRELRQAVVTPGREGAALRRTARRGARLALAGDVESVAGRLREELAELDRIRSEAELILDAGRDEYARFLGQVEFYELDQVFEKVLEHFRIPILDDVYAGFRSVIGFVSKNVVKLVSGKEPQDGREKKLAERREQDRQKLKELLDTTRSAINDLPHAHTQVLSEAAATWLEGLVSKSPDEQNLAVETFLDEAQVEAERWIEAQTAAHVEMLEKHPYAKAALRTVKGVFQVGFGVLSAYLTHGFGPWDVLIGTATERAVKKILESAGGYMHYQTLRQQFSRERAGLLRGLLATEVQAPFSAHLPSGVEPARLERLSTSVGWLREEEL
ncbi:MAG: dynamin family protein [Planctomycetes bacterium]|nr:dynamin family protein [Planctomycetota bacterium]